MANRFTDRDDFTISSALLDEHEWTSDAFIDSMFGTNCRLIYPQKVNPCDNCVQDVDSGLSTGIYKAGGPISFTNYTICPRCNGVGKLYVNTEETIKCRVYYNRYDFMGGSDALRNAKMFGDTDIIQIITYMEYLPKLERAIELIVNSHIAGYREYRCQPYSAPTPHGFRRNRYISQFWKRTGGS